MRNLSVPQRWLFLLECNDIWSGRCSAKFSRNIYSYILKKDSVYSSETSAIRPHDVIPEDSCSKY
jgi:hypothetical protein